MPSENLIMKLPSELRNRIYELALPLHKTVKIHARRKASYKYSRDRLIRCPKLRWREPALLFVSKQIRPECQGLYYSNNHFEIVARSAELEEVLDFLLLKSPEDEDAEGDITLSYRVIMWCPRWRDFKHWLKLAAIAWHTGSDEWNQPEQLLSATGAGWWAEQYSRVLQGMRDVVALGLKAKRRGLEWEDLMEHFVDWAASAINVSSRVRHPTVEMAEVMKDVFGRDVFAHRDYRTW